MPRADLILYNFRTICPHKKANYSALDMDYFILDEKTILA
jgi:glutaredoxin